MYYSYEELKSEIERYVKYYNKQRIKVKRGWRSPVQYRLSLLAAIEEGNDLLPYSRVGHPSASADMLPWGARVHKKCVADKKSTTQ